MICDSIEKCAQAHVDSPGFEKAWNFLFTADLHSLPEGKHAIDGADVFAIIETVNGKGRHNARLEAHRKYIDIQCCLEGSDVIGVKALAECMREDVPYNDERDIVFLSDSIEEWITIREGVCAIFFPNDAHAPLACDEKVKKVVIKIKTRDN